MLGRGEVIAISLNGYKCTRIDFKLRLDEWISVEVSIHRKDNDSLLPKLSFLEKLTNIKKLGQKLAKQLELVNGDVTTTNKVLYKYY